MPDPAWDDYLGLYTDPAMWDEKVILLAGRLYLYNHDYPPEDSARRAAVVLSPMGPKTYRVMGEDSSGDIVVFETGPKGWVTRVKVGKNNIFPKARPTGLKNN